MPEQKCESMYIKYSSDICIRYKSVWGSASSDVNEFAGDDMWKQQNMQRVDVTVLSRTDEVTHWMSKKYIL